MVRTLPRLILMCSDCVRGMNSGKLYLLLCSSRHLDRRYSRVRGVVVQGQVYRTGR
jgi:hypothetical protein